MSALRVLFSYLAMGPLTGVLFGLAFPLMRRWFAAYLVGVAASVPFALSVVAGIQPLRPWTGGHTFVLAAMTLSLGGLGGLMVRDLGVAPGKRRRSRR